MYPFIFQFREDLLGQSKKADDMSRVAGLDNQGIVVLQRQIMKGIVFLWFVQ
jgi:syntaxin of plants SYP5